MKVKWMKKRFTFMVIPDANNGVVRFRISGMILYLIPIVVLLLVISTLSFYLVQMRSQLVAKQLESELNTKNKEFQFTVTDKNDTIDQLQNQLIQLSQQANDVQTKIDQLQKLEDDVKSITGDGSKATGSTAGKRNAALLDGVGGEEAPLSGGDTMSVLVNHTKSQYSSLGEESGKLVESLSSLKSKVLAAQEQLRMTPTIWPSDSRQVTSPFGYRRDPFTRAVSFHNGIDFGGSLNDPVYAAAEGVVVTTGYDSAHGNNVIIKHLPGTQTWYMHLNKISVNEGDKVTKGQKIGLMGTTGRSTGVHLHYTVLKNGDAVDPRPYLNASRKEE